MISRVRLVLVASLFAACTSFPPTDTPPPEELLELPDPVVLPDLDDLAPSVQRQLRARHDAVRTSESSGASPTARAEAYGALAMVLQAAGFLTPTENAYRHAQAADPGDLRWSYYLAHLQQATGRRGEAIANFERVLAIDSEHVPSLVWLGEMHLDQGAPGDAAAAYERALALAPASAAALAGLGRAALAQQDAERAATYLERALRLEPGATSLHYSLGMAYRDLGDQARAALHLAQHGDGAPSLPDPLLQAQTGLLESGLAHERRGMRALAAGRFDEAAAAFRAGLALAPDDATLHHRLGVALMESADTRGAGEQFAEALRLEPDFAEAHLSLGHLHAQSNRFAEAIRSYEAAVEHRPNYLDAHFALADALTRTGQLSDALPHFERITVIDPAFADAWMARGVSLVQLARYREAYDWLTRAREIHPDDARILFLLVRLLAAAPDAGVRDGGRALTLMETQRGAPLSLELYETLAMALAEAGRFPEAVDFQRRAIAAAQQTGQTWAAPYLAENLARYESGQACRTPLPPAPGATG